MDLIENREDWETAFRANWLTHWQETGQIDWQRYPRLQNQQAPAGKGVDLKKARLMLISSAGGYLPLQHQPFDAANPLGDYSIRRIPIAAPLAEIRFAHDHYDHAAVEADPQVALPLRHLEAMVADGSIGALAATVVSFMGYQPDVTRVADETFPAVLQAVQEEQVDAVLLVPV